MIRWGTVQWSRDTVAIERYTTTTLRTHTVRISMRPHQQNSYLVSEMYVNHSHTIICWACKYNTYTTVLKFGVGKIFKCFWKKSQMPHKTIFIWPKKSLLLLLSENTIVNIIKILLFGSLPQPTGPVPAPHFSVQYIGPRGFPHPEQGRQMLSFVVDDVAPSRPSRHLNTGMSSRLGFLNRIAFTNGSVYQGYTFRFSAQFGPVTHFSLAAIPPTSTGFTWQ